MVDVSGIVVHVHANNWDAFARPWSGGHKCRVEIPVYLEVNVDSNLVAGNMDTLSSAVHCRGGTLRGDSLSLQ